MNDLLIALYLTDEHTELKVELFYLWHEPIQTFALDMLSPE